MGKTLTMTTDDYKRLRRKIDKVTESLESVAVHELNRELLVATEELAAAGRGVDTQELRALHTAAKRLEGAANSFRFDLITTRALAGNVANAARFWRLVR